MNIIFCVLCRNIARLVNDYLEFYNVKEKGADVNRLIKGRPVMMLHGIKYTNQILSLGDRNRERSGARL